MPTWVYALQVGNRAPLFEALSTHGTIKLQDYQGRKHVVLAFYFADFTPVWDGELQAFQYDIKKFESLNTQVLGVSFDTLEIHKKLAKEYGISYPLISDPSGKVRNLYAPGRITFLIDKKGFIRYIQKGVPKNEDLLREIKKLEKSPWRKETVVLQLLFSPLISIVAGVASPMPVIHIFFYKYGYHPDTKVYNFWYDEIICL